jgi:hypothetical protein
MSRQSVRRTAKSDQEVLCPSAPPQEGALLLSIARPGGNSAYLRDRLPITAEFLDEANRSRSIGQRFRFASPCLQSTCAQWFVVDLGNIKLPPIIVRQIESEIRAVVLKALANPELGEARRPDPSIFRYFPGRTLGLWIDPDHPERGSWGIRSRAERMSYVARRPRNNRTTQE